MKIRFALLAFIISLSLLAVPFGAWADNSWQSVGDGIDYQEIQTNEPMDIYVARMARIDHPNTILDSAVAQGRISYGTETVSQMAKRYDGAINTWGGAWGPTNKVVVAINGSYFNGIGAPLSGQIISGWYAKRFDNLGGGSGLGYRMDQSVFVGQCVNHNPQKQTVSIYRSGQAVASFPMDGLNIPRGSNQLILYTPQYDDATHTTADGVEALVEMSRPTLILPQPNYASGAVAQILDHHGQSAIPFDSIILSASGTARSKLLAALHPGDEVRISQEITTYDKDCQSQYGASWTKTYASVGGAFNILRDGAIQTSTDKGAVEKDPRTAIAYNDDYIFFIVVDGRDSQHSAGMTFTELATFARDTLGATWAMAQDGGGSSVMVVNGQVKNHPVSLCPSIYLPLIINGAAPAQTLVTPTPGAQTAAPTQLYACERSVSNAMMMVNVQSPQNSDAFQPADKVSTLGSTEVRLGPGTNYGVIAMLPAGTQGSIVHQAPLDGIEAKGAHWWKATFGDVTGWVDESAIGAPAPRPTVLPHNLRFFGS